jgi:hypothetical protein
MLKCCTNGKSCQQAAQLSNKTKQFLPSTPMNNSMKMAVVIPHLLFLQDSTFFLM